MEHIKKIFKSMAPALYEKLWRMRDRFYKRRERKRLFWQRQEIMRSYDPNPFYLNIGSSLFARKNWRLLDYADSSSYKVGDSGELLDYNIDLTKNTKFPIPDSSVDLIFSSHVLEHIGDKAAQNVFNEARRLLKQGGVFRVVLPDADSFYNAYKRNDILWFRGITRRWDRAWPIETHYFKWVSAPHMTTMEGVREDIGTLSKEEFFEKYRKEITDFTNHDFQQHITWFNFGKVEKMAEKAGFTDIRSSLPRQSISEEMRAPEFDTREQFSLYVDIVR